MGDIKNILNILFKPFQPLVIQAITFIYSKKYLTIIFIISITTILLKFTTLTVEFIYTESVQKSEYTNFSNGLDIAEMESTVEFLENCNKGITNKRTTVELECNYALDLFIFQVVMRGKTPIELANIKGEYYSHLDGIEKQAVDQKAYTLMKSLINSQIRRSKNAFKNGSKDTLSNRLSRSFLFSPVLTVILTSLVLILVVSIHLRAKNAYK